MLTGTNSLPIVNGAAILILILILILIPGWACPWTFISLRPRRKGMEERLAARQPAASRGEASEVS